MINPRDEDDSRSWADKSQAVEQDKRNYEVCDMDASSNEMCLVRRKRLR